MRIVQIGGAYINPEFVVALYPAANGRSTRIVMSSGPEIMADEYPSSVAAALEPPPPEAFPDDDIPY